MHTISLYELTHFYLLSFLSNYKLLKGCKMYWTKHDNEEEFNSPKYETFMFDLIWILRSDQIHEELNLKMWKWHLLWTAIKIFKCVFIKLKNLQEDQVVQ